VWLAAAHRCMDVEVEVPALDPREWELAIPALRLRLVVASTPARPAKYRDRSPGNGAPPLHLYLITPLSSGPLSATGHVMAAQTPLQSGSIATSPSNLIQRSWNFDPATRKPRSDPTSEKDACKGS